MIGNTPTQANLVQSLASLVADENEFKKAFRTSVQIDIASQGSRGGNLRSSRSVLGKPSFVQPMDNTIEILIEASKTFFIGKN